MSSNEMSSFIDALLGARTPVIMEIKRRSAHGDDLFRGRSVREIVDDYHRLDAPCLSVVTGSWFGGDDDLFREVVELTDRPVLIKDLIIKESQIEEAKAMGAAAVLLTAELLPGSLVRRLTEASLGHGITPFIEVTKAKDIKSLVNGKKCVMAVNNKGIRQRERGRADIGRSFSLLPVIRQSGTRCSVSASGIDSPQAAAQLLAAGFKALLIGTGLLLAGDVQAWLSELEEHRMRRPDRRSAIGVSTRES